MKNNEQATEKALAAMTERIRQNVNIFTEAEERYVIRERRSESFSRSFKLPENADMEAITASFKNGLLSLEIKKRAEAKKRVIQIEGGKPSTL